MKAISMCRPLREDVKSIPTPVTHVYELRPKCDIIKLNERIREKALSSLISYKDTCVYPVECRFLSFESSDEPYYIRSMPIYKSERFKPKYPRKVFITKMCNLRIKGFRRIRSQCQYKNSVSLTMFDQKKGSKTG